jgi:hypothetical protein
MNRPTTPERRKGTPSPRIEEPEFRQRFLSQFKDPAFNPLKTELDRIVAAAWDAYKHQRKSAETSKAGQGFHDPEYDLAVEWIDAKAKVDAAQRQYDSTPVRRVLLISGSPRSEHTCPGEMSKSYRLVEIAREVFNQSDEVDAEVLELGRLTSEYGRKIHPCKACFSTSPALCHWPCSCYPNYSLGQTQDWMNDIYPMWVAAHGVMIVTPVNCIGYWKPYATNHEELDADTAIQDEVRNAAQTLLEAVIAQRDGQFVAAGKDLHQPRQK